MAKVCYTAYAVYLFTHPSIYVTHPYIIPGSIHPFLSFDTSKENFVLTIPLGNVSYLRPFCCTLYPHSPYEYTQALRQESLQYGAEVDVHDNRTWQDPLAPTPNSHHKEPCHVPRNEPKARWTGSYCRFFSICRVPNQLVRPGFDLPHYISMVIG